MKPLLFAFALSVFFVAGCHTQDPLEKSENILAPNEKEVIQTVSPIKISEDGQESTLVDDAFGYQFAFPSEFRLNEVSETSSDIDGEYFDRFWMTNKSFDPETPYLGNGEMFASMRIYTDERTLSERYETTSVFSDSKVDEYLLSAERCCERMVSRDDMEIKKQETLVDGIPLLITSGTFPVFEEGSPAIVKELFFERQGSVFFFSARIPLGDKSHDMLSIFDEMVRSLTFL